MKFSLMVVDLSTSEKTAGARIIPLTQYFNKRGYKVTLFINGVTKKTYLPLLGDLRKVINIKTFPFSGHFAGGKVLVGLEYFKRIIISPFVKVKKDIDVFYSLTGIICDVFPSFIFKKRTGKVWLANVDNIEAPPSQKPGSFLVGLFAFLLFKLSVFLLRWADAVFVTTPLSVVKQALVNGGINPKKIILSNNGIPLDFIQKMKAPAKERYDAAFLGRIHQGKGVFDLVKAWKEITIKNPKIKKIILVGSGDKETVNRLEEEIKKNDLGDKMTLAGFVDEKRKYQLLKSAEIFVYPSYYDANPISPVEALACGLPVVAYDLPIFRNHYPPGLVQTVARGDVEAISKTVVELLNDEKKRRILQAKGLKLAKQFSWQEIFKRQEEVLTAALKK